MFYKKVVRTNCSAAIRLCEAGYTHTCLMTYVLRHVSRLKYVSPNPTHLIKWELTHCVRHSINIKTTDNRQTLYLQNMSHGMCLTRLFVQFLVQPLCMLTRARQPRSRLTAHFCLWWMFYLFRTACNVSYWLKMSLPENEILNNIEFVTALEEYLVLYNLKKYSNRSEQKAWRI